MVLSSLSGLNIFRSTIAILFGIQAVKSTAVQTLYYVDPPVETATAISYEVQGTTVISAIQTLESGITRYGEKIVESLVILHAPPTVTTGTTVVTAVTEPFTIIGTFEQGASTQRYSNPAATLTLSDGAIRYQFASSQSCKLDIGKQSGECIDIHEEEIFTGTVDIPSTTTVTTTYTGSLIPFATVTVVSNSGHMTRMQDMGVTFSLISFLLGYYLLV